LGGAFLAMFANPVGWLIVLVSLITLAIVLLKHDFGTPRILAHRSHRHGPEDRRRGSGDDPMLR